MKHLLRGGIAACAMAMGALFASSALAATGPWNWTDLSSQLATTANRPVWASAYANGSWYYTDGIDLSAGGHVYRYDGATQVDITSDLYNSVSFPSWYRNVLTRVDDIVSDGSRVWFLKDMTARNNAFQIVEYASNSYTNISSSIASALASDEGIAQVAGNNGVWAILTSKGRILIYTSSTRGVQIVRSSTISQTLPYAQNHDAAGTAGFLRMAIQPLGSGFVLENSAYGAGSGVTMTKIEANGAQSNVGSGYTIDTVSSFASNGSRVLIGGYSGSSVVYYTFDGSVFRNVSFSGVNQITNPAVTMTEWTGTSWFILNGKNIYRLTDSAFESYGQTRDYFTTASSNGNGTMMLGGAVSTDGSSQPSYPLTAKFVKVTENAGYVSTGSSVTQTYQTTASNTVTQNGVSVWGWTDPNQSWLNRNQTMTFYAGAWSGNGIQHMDMYVNGTLRRTCWLGNATGNQQCSTTLYGGDYSSYQNVTLSAQATDATGNVAWMQQQNIQVTDAYSSVNGNYFNGNSSYDISAWGTMDPANSTMNRNASVTYHAQASATAGLSRMDVYANDGIVRTCWLNGNTATQSCDATIYGYNYSANTGVNVRVLATDVSGRTAWSDTKTVTFSDTSSSYGTSGSLWVSSWLDPANNTVATNATTNFRVQASANAGLSRIDVYANSTLLRSCPFYTAYGTQNCDVAISGGNYSAGTQLALSARAIDINNQSNLGSTTFLTVQSPTTNINANSGSGTTANFSSWVWSSPDQSTIARNGSVTFYVGAWDRDGVQRIDVLVNGSIWNTCAFNGGAGNQQCSAVINGSSFSSGATVTANARMTDVYGNAFWSDTRSYVVGTDATTASYGWGKGMHKQQVQNANGKTPWITSDHERGYRNGDVIAFTATSDSAQNLKILVDGMLIKTCDNATSCSITRTAFGKANSMSYAATATDWRGNTTWTGYKQLKKY